MSATEDGVYIALAERRRDALEMLLQERKGYTRKQLLNKLTEATSDVRDGGMYALRTLINDMDYLERSGPEIEKLKRKAKSKSGRIFNEYYYRYVNAKSTYKKQKLDPETLASIKIAASILKQIPEIQLHDDLKEIYETLKLHSDAETEERPYILFDNYGGASGLNHIPKILQAIHDKGVIQFAYQPFQSVQSTNEIVHPYLLKQYKSRWYLIGLNDEKKDIQHYGLDRIKSRMVVVDNKRKFEVLRGFNPVNYFENVIGVSVKKNTKPEEIILRMARSRAMHLDNAPLHKSQTIISHDETTKTYSFCLIPNYELTNWILSYGPEVEVLKPENLKKNVAELILEAGKKYI